MEVEPEPQQQEHQPKQHPEHKPQQLQQLDEPSSVVDFCEANLL